MGTTYCVKVADVPQNVNWENVAAAIQNELDTVDRLMSTYKPDSEVCRFNVFRQSDIWFPVSKQTAEVIAAALDISHQTDGAFDITVAPLVNLWGFGPNKTGRSPQTLKEESLKLKLHTGYQKLVVRLDPPALKKSDAELTIDLSAIAKGYAVDRVADYLEQNGFKNYMIEVGGEVRCGGKKSALADWIIGIENPSESAEQAGSLRQIPLKNRGLATSGSYRQKKMIDGKPVSHFIDPRTGLPKNIDADTDSREILVSVSVIADCCMLADAWATALFVADAERGLQLAEKNNLAVLFLVKRGETVREVATPSFP
ncbi:hypothetical protein FACS189454_02170 [Planctomycetales bacterium]|nr:hypothetical protein FACS189454_02170 [Planctomycetales bacterium]